MRNNTSRCVLKDVESADFFVRGKYVAEVAEDGGATAVRSWIDVDEHGAGASPEPSMVNSQSASVSGTVGHVGGGANARFVGGSF